MENEDDKKSPLNGRYRTFKAFGCIPEILMLLLTPILTYSGIANGINVKNGIHDRFDAYVV